MAFKYVQRKKPQDEGEFLAHETSRSGLNEIPFIVLSLSPDRVSQPFLFGMIYNISVKGQRQKMPSDKYQNTLFENK